MAPEKEEMTTMILYVDLKCPCCYKRVRKLLCTFPQIRDQVFDVDKNKVIITVVCCDPERLRDKLCCKGGRDILSIEIVEKKTTRTPTQTSTTTPPVTTTTTPTQRKPVSVCCRECYEGRDGGPCHYGYGRPQPHLPFCPPISVCCQECYEGRDGGPCHRQQPFRPPISNCCQECYEGRDGGPCHYGSGRPVPPPQCNDYYGYQYPPNRPCYVSRCDCFNEDNPQGCSIM